ncbi:MAG: DUF1805 domain-containing protein [Planctomycetota bacterium]
MAFDWNGFTKTRHPLRRPLLVVSNDVGCLTCGYLSLDSFERNGDAAAIVRGVDHFEDMLAAEIRAVSSRAADLGVKEGMSGEEALEIYSARSRQR